MKADVVVFRGSNGVAYVRPSPCIVEFKAGKNEVYIRNDAETQVHIVITHDGGVVTETLQTAKPNHKKPVNVTNLKQNGSSVIQYHVFLGSEEAEGNSAPTLIIDD